jgi:homoserine dehydrogenase
MKNQKEVKIGVLGLGVVGAEFVSLMLKNEIRIANDTGMHISIEKIYVRTENKARNIDTTNLPLTNNISDIIDNPEIDIICECMGGNGCDDTNLFIQKALDNGKHVIMSSKKALARNAEILVNKAKQNNKHLKYDASVGGAIPVAKVIEQVFKGDRVVKIFGIFNATSNYIYSKMRIEKESFSCALVSAQNIGYAENDPSEDIDGIDSLNKLVILSVFGMNLIINPKLLEAESFQHINRFDMNCAKDLGFSIKPIALLKANGGCFEYKIGPCLVSENHIVANTHNNYNAVIIEGENTGELGFYGQGAGAKPTASAMFDDLINVLKNPHPDWEQQFITVNRNALQNYESEYYFRISNNTEKGGYAVIDKVLSEHGIQIKKQLNVVNNNGNIEMIVLTNEISNQQMKNIRENLKSLNFEMKTVLSVI